MFEIFNFIASDKVYQLLAYGRWFSLGTPASSTTKTGRHHRTEILLKVALNTKNQNQINFIEGIMVSLFTSSETDQVKPKTLTLVFVASLLSTQY